MAFNGGYIYNLQTSERFQNLTKRLDAEVFTVKEFLDVIDVIEAGAFTEDRLEEISEEWFATKYIPTKRIDQYNQVIERSAIPDHFKILLQNIVDIMASGQTSSMNYLDRMGLIAGNLFFIQNTLKAFNARLLDLTYLTHVKYSKALMSLVQGDIAQGISFGLSNKKNTSLCTFYTLNVAYNMEFISLADEEERKLLEDYLGLHQQYIDIWDHKPNSIPLDFKFHKKLVEFSEAKQIPDRVSVKATPVCFYGQIWTKGYVNKLGEESTGNLVVLDQNRFELMREFHMVEILESLRSTFIAFMDVNLINTKRTFSLVPIAFRNDIFLIIEYNELIAADSGKKFPQRLGIIYHVERTLQASPTSLSDIVKRHIPVLPELFNQIDIWMKEEDPQNPNLTMMQSYIAAKLKEIEPSD